jgi:hypothetical protein
MKMDSHIYITSSGTFSTNAKRLASSRKFKEIVKKYSKKTEIIKNVL